MRKPFVWLLVTTFVIGLPQSANASLGGNIDTITADQSRMVVRMHAVARSGAGNLHTLISRLATAPPPKFTSTRPYRKRPYRKRKASYLKKGQFTVLTKGSTIVYFDTTLQKKESVTP